MSNTKNAKSKSGYYQNVRVSWEEQLGGKGKHYSKQSRTITAFGNTKKALRESAQERYEWLRERLEQDSPNGNKKRKWNYGLEGSSQKTQQPAGKNRVAMRHYVLDLDDATPQTWDTRTGRCVFDYLIHIYGGADRFKKLVNYEKLNDLFRSDEPDELNPLEQGVSVQQLTKFVEFTGVPMYAFDANDNLITYHTPTTRVRNGSLPCLIFKCWNSHFYPIEDEQVRMSVVRKVYSNTDVKSNLISDVKTESTKVYNIIAPEPKMIDGEEHNYNQDEANNFALEQIFSRNQIPSKVNDKSLYFANGRIERLRLGDDIILTEPICEPVKQFLESNDRVYQGENPIALLFDVWENEYDFKFSESPIFSSLNPQVLECLLTDGVKTRTHYGATRDLTEYLVLVEEYDEVQEIVETTTDFQTPFGEKKTKKTKTKKVKKVKREPITRIEKMLETGEAVCCDIEKCYSSLLLNPMDDWIIFDSFDNIELFGDADYYYNDTELPLGLYFIESDDLTLLHQSNWYSNTMVDYAKEVGVKFVVKYQIRVVEKFETLDEDKEIVKFDNKWLFQRIINSITEQTEDNIPLRKLLINQITGCLGKTRGKKLNVNLTTNPTEVWENFMVPNALLRKDVFIHPLTYQDKTIWINGHTELTEHSEIALPMYIQILDWSNIKLHKMAQLVGGDIIFRKTDCIVSIGGTIPENKIIDTICCPEEQEKTREILDEDGELEELEDYTETFELLKDACKTWGCIRNESGTSFNYSSQMKHQRHIETPKVNDAWNTFNYKDSDEYNNILHSAIDGKGMLILGRAGTGKTFVIHKGIEQGLIEDKADRRLAFTNRAARNINGTTIHKALAINSAGKTNSKTLSKFKPDDIIVVDEISMISLELWKLLQLIKQKCGCIFILLGDYRQCRPIERQRTDIDDYDYFNHPIVKYLTNNNKCELSVRKRYDKPLWDYAEKLYEQGVAGDEIKYQNVSIEQIYNSKNLCYFNKTRDFINDLCMNHYKKQAEQVICLEYDRATEDDNDKAKTAYLYIGLPVMSVKNSTKLEIINSEEFMIVELDDEEFVLKRDEDDELMTFDIEDFHKYFVVNYCATTHKSQGATIEIPIIIWDWNKLQQDRNVGYTAITRAKAITQICFGKAPQVDK